MMSEAVAGLLESIRALPSEDRGWITEQLLMDQSASGIEDVSLDPEFLAIIQDRLRDARRHPEKLVDGDTVLANARKRLLGCTK